MVVTVIHNVISHYGINQPMNSVIHVVLLWLKRHIKMERLRNSVPMKRVQLDRQRKLERKRAKLVKKL